MIYFKNTNKNKRNYIGILFQCNLIKKKRKKISFLNIKNSYKNANFQEDTFRKVFDAHPTGTLERN